MSLSDAFKEIDPLQGAVSGYLDDVMGSYPDGQSALVLVKNTVLDVLKQNDLIPTNPQQKGPCIRLIKTVLTDLFSILNADVQRLVASDPEDAEHRRQKYGDEGRQIKEDMEEGFLWGTLSDSDREGVARIITNQTLQRAADSAFRYDLKLAAQMGTALADKNAIQPVYDFMREIAEKIFADEDIYKRAEKEWVSFCESSGDPCDPTSPEMKSEIRDTIVHATCTAVYEYLVDKTIVAISSKIAQGMDEPSQKKGPGPDLGP
jgi:hypothetical protein